MRLERSPRRASALVCCAAMLGAVSLWAPPAHAQEDIGIRRVGIRGGLTVNPDQGHVGLHINAGRFAERVRFQPSFDVGFGSDRIVGTINVDGSFTEKSWTPRKVEGRKTGFAWFWRAVNESQAALTQAEVWHDGHCSCCGKKLTVPESLSTGIGPICAGLRYNPEGLNTHLGK